MKCDRCGKNDATFYYKSNINGRVTETHLSQDCARQMGYAEPMASRMGGWFDDDWFARPFSRCEPLFGGLGSRMLTEFPQPVNVLEQAQTADEKADDGLLPKEEAAGLALERKRNALRTQLHNAVEEERYEDAAKLRDELKSLRAEGRTIPIHTLRGSVFYV